MTIRSFYSHSRGRRYHQFLQPSGIWGTCGGPGLCRECIREVTEPYVSIETKAIIRVVFEEHVGAAAADWPDQQPLSGLDIEWTILTMALETQTGMEINEVTLADAGTIDQIARILDDMRKPDALR